MHLGLQPQPSQTHLCQQQEPDRLCWHQPRSGAAQAGARGRPGLRRRPIRSQRCRRPAGLQRGRWTLEPGSLLWWGGLEPRPVSCRQPGVTTREGTGTTISGVGYTLISKPPRAVWQQGVPPSGCCRHGPAAERHVRQQACRCASCPIIQSRDCGETRISSREVSVQLTCAGCAAACTSHPANISPDGTPAVSYLADGAPLCKGVAGGD